MTSAFTSPTGLCDLCCCHRVIARYVFPQKNFSWNFHFLKSGAQLHESISINAYGDIPTRQVRIYSCVDVSGTVGTSKYKWKRCRELEGRQAEKAAERQREISGCYKEVTPDSVLFSAFPSAHCGCSLNLCVSLTGTVRLNDLWVLRSHAWAQILSDVLNLTVFSQQSDRLPMAV